MYASRPHALFAYAAIASATLATVFTNLNPYILKKLVDGLTTLTSQEEIISLLIFWGGLYVLLMGLGFIFYRISGFIGVEWLSRLNKTAYETLYGYIAHHSHQYFADRFAGAISNKISNAADGSERIVDRVLWGWYLEMISITAGTVLLFIVDSLIAAGFLMVVAVVAVVNLYLVKRRRPHVVAYANASSRLRGDGVDFLTNMTAARQYARRGYEIGRISNSAEDRRRKDVRQWRMGEWMMVFNNTIVALMIVAIFAYLLVLFKAGSITAGDIILTLAVMGRMSHIIIFLGQMMSSFIRVYGEIEEGLKTILRPYDIEDKNGAAELVAHQGLIVWDKVRFEYDHMAVFADFNLTIEPKQRVGLVGPSGAGKTTFVSLLLRQHEIQAGAIAIDGQNIAEVTQDSLRRALAVVPQEPNLFHRSIRENIAYGKPEATEAEIIEVAKKAQAHDFIDTLPEGYDTLVGERGVKLSGGQRQRVAIARAMLKNAPILVLDEATSALDSESEVAIQKALHELMEGKTVIAIAHRLSTLREMDRILVLEDGKIVEDGKHETLTKTGGTYSRLWDHQAGGFLQE